MTEDDLDPDSPWVSAIERKLGHKIGPPPPDDDAMAWIQPGLCARAAEVVFHGKTVVDAETEVEELQVGQPTLDVNEAKSLLRDRILELRKLELCKLRKRFYNKTSLGLQRGPYDTV